MAWLGFFALAPFFYHLFSSKKSTKTLAFEAWIFGFLWMGYVHHWMFFLTDWVGIGWLLLLWAIFCMYLAVYFAIGALLFRILEPFCGRVLSISFVWILCEWLRSLGPAGDPAGVIGYAFSESLWVTWAWLGGIYFLSWMAVLSSAVVAEWFVVDRIQKIKQVIVFLTLSLVFCTGANVMHKGIAEASRAVKVALVQGNHAQSVKLNESSWNYVRNDYLRLTQVAVAERPQLVFWPETISPDLNYGDKAWILNVFQTCLTYNCGIVWGTPILENQKPYNALSVISKQQGINTEWYSKQKLMPFGEYWPLRGFFRFFKLDYLLSEDYQIGLRNSNLQVQNVVVGPMICLESLFPQYARDLGKKGAQLLYVAANNAWFKKSIAADLHFKMTQIRAVENELPLVQVSNTGISGIVLPDGTLQTKLPANQQIVWTGLLNIPTKTHKTPFQIAGHWILGLSGILCGLLGIVRRFKFKKTI